MSCRPTLFHHVPRCMFVCVRAHTPHCVYMCNTRVRARRACAPCSYASIPADFHVRPYLESCVYHGERPPITFDDHTLECKVRSERVKGSAREVRPLNSRRARGCTSGSTAKNISWLDTSLIACTCAARISTRANQGKQGRFRDTGGVWWVAPAARWARS